MNTYQGIITKAEFLKELRKHQKADAFKKGTYEQYTKKLIGTRFKGCAVGCSLESIKRTKKIDIKLDDHTQYAKLLGIPIWLARVEDRIFEGLPVYRSKKWPVEFANAIPENVDLEQVKPKFLIMILESALTSFDHAKYPEVKEVIEKVIALWRRCDIGSESFHQDASAAYAAADAACAAADAAADAAYAAADAACAAADAAAADAAYAAADAACAAADAAAYAADAAYAAADAADAACAACATRGRVRSEKYEYFADELLKMLKECK